MHVKVGDKVKVIAGQAKGKIGSIKGLNKKTSQVVVEGINIKVKHTKPGRANENAQIQKLEFPIHSSNVSKYEEKIE